MFCHICIALLQSTNKHTYTHARARSKRIEWNMSFDLVNSVVVVIIIFASFAMMFVYFVSAFFLESLAKLLTHHTNTSKVYRSDTGCSKHQQQWKIF